LQPIAGRFEVERDVVWFVPRFPFLDGRTYALLVSTGAGGWRGEGAERWEVWRPAPLDQPSTRVIAVHPAASVVPCNLLKLYIEFSAPMSEGRALSGVSVRRADSNILLEGVFLQMEPELWNPERRRLTMLLDPGRIKRGLVPNQEAGYPLVEGVPIVVRVEGLLDAAGQPLAAPFERRYEVGPVLRKRVEPKAWRIETPRAGTLDSLEVTFDRPLDHALLRHAITIREAEGGLVAGEGTAVEADLGWRFVPAQAWEVRRFRLMVDSRLEDLAGNSVMRVFDRDITRDELAGAEAGVVEWEVAG
jgi:hypothetical protein